jgi:hypothetical protein
VPTVLHRAGATPMAPGVSAANVVGSAGSYNMQTIATGSYGLALRALQKRGNAIEAGLERFHARGKRDPRVTFCAKG